MWMIELNIAGYQFTMKRLALRFSPRAAHWPVLRHSQAA